MPTIAAPRVATDPTAVIALASAGSALVRYRIDRCEFALAAIAFPRHSRPQLAAAAAEDCACYLDNRTDRLVSAIEGNARKAE